MFKVIFFQIDKDVKINKMNKFEGIVKSIDKVMVNNENKKTDMKKDDDKQRKNLMEGQKKMHAKLDYMLKEIQNLPYN